MPARLPRMRQRIHLHRLPPVLTMDMSMPILAMARAKVIRQLT